jgi:hypothetical protein
MPPHRRLRAPAGNGEVLADPGFDAIPALVEANRRRLDRSDVVVGGLPLRELRALARREVLAAAQEYTGFSLPSPLAGQGGSRSEPGEGSSLASDPSPAALRAAALSRKGRGQEEDRPLLLAGHQPELAHPGVWVKHFALNGLARKLGGTPLHLIVDNDTLKSTSLRFPVFRDHDPGSVHLQSLPFDRLADRLPYEYATVQDELQFRSFADRAATIVRGWPFVPLLQSLWPRVVTYPTPWIGEKFTAARVELERGWGGGNNELRVRDLSELRSFGHFVHHLIEDAPRFAAVYNAAINRYRAANGLRSKSRPVPNLAVQDGWTESPFWGQQHGGYFHARRGRVFVKADGKEARVGESPGALVTEALRTFRIRPRALTLTLFARVCLGDFFVHGIGGGKYDEVTDAIIRDYFGIDPPAYQVLSATLHLPLPAFPSDPDDAERAARHLRDLTWNPQRHLPPDAAARPAVRQLVEEKAALAAAEPPYPDHDARREWFRDLRGLTDRLRRFVADQIADAEAALDRARAEARANAVLRRRDYAWVLYPEATLRPFLQRFLEM